MCRSRSSKGFVERPEMVEKSRTWDTIEFDARRSSNEHGQYRSGGGGDRRFRLQQQQPSGGARERTVER